MMQENLQLSTVNTTWIENLALEELNMEESGVVQFNDHLNPQHLLEESGLQFIEQVREKFEIYINRFNMYRAPNDSGFSIKIFKISGTVNDFMVFRNSLKLVIARRSVDVISIGFLSNAGGMFSARLNLNTPAINMAHEIKAHVGPFNEITWRYNGEILNIDTMVRHYLTEFVKHSAR